MLDRERAIAWYRRNRERTRTLFDMVAPDTYYKRPIALRHPIVFYEGHLPAFSFNTLVKKGLGGPSIDPRLEAIFARGIDPHENSASSAGPKGPALQGANVGRVLLDPAADKSRAGRVATKCSRSRMKPIAACSTPCAGPISIVQAILCSIARKRCSRSSSTRRCITRRCFTCGIVCRSRRSGA